MTQKYEVVIEAIPEEPIPVLRALRELGGWGLRETKELLEYSRLNCPCVLIAGVNQELATKFTDRLNSSGATVVLKESSINRPMLLYPRLDERYKDHWLFGLKKTDS